MPAFAGMTLTGEASAPVLWAIGRLGEKKFAALTAFQSLSLTLPQIGHENMVF